MEGLIQAHQSEVAQLGLGCQEAIKRIAVGQHVAAGMQAMLKLDRQQLETLGCQELGQGVDQFACSRQLAQAHLGGDLPAGGRTHEHPGALIGNGGMGYGRKALRTRLQSPGQLLAQQIAQWWSPFLLE